MLVFLVPAALSGRHTSPSAAALCEAAAELNQSDDSVGHRRENAPRHAVLVAQDAKSFDAPNPVFDAHPYLGYFSVAFFLFRRQFAAFGFLGRRRDLRLLLIGISFVAQNRFITQRLGQLLLELALFLQLDVGLRSAMASRNVEDLAFAVGDNLSLDRVLLLFA